MARSAYYKWLKRNPSESQKLNEEIADLIKQHYEETNGILGYRQMAITINREHNVHYNKKRIYRLMQIMHLKSVTRIKKKNYIPSAPEITAENLLNRDFHTDTPNEKWLTDVTEFKYYVGPTQDRLQSISAHARLVRLLLLIWSGANGINLRPSNVNKSSSQKRKEVTL